jgi:hypothetical protein
VSDADQRRARLDRAAVSDAEGDGDGELGAMRSMWLEMRDEEPPARGMAELLAAARQQAEVMVERARPPWWRRMFAIAMRPPVLAAVTVVVLLGGAVLIGRRGDTFETSMRAPAGSPGPEVTRGGAALEAPHEPSVDPVIEEAAAQPTAVALDTAEPPPRPSFRQKRSAAVTSAPEPGAPPPPTPPLEIASGDDDLGTDVAQRGVDETRRPELDATGAPQPEPTTASQLQRSPRRPSVEQLVQQTEVAARRDDCAAVRVTAERVKKLDATVYRERLERQPAIRRCLK